MIAEFGQHVGARLLQAGNAVAHRNRGTPGRRLEQQRGALAQRLFDRHDRGQRLVLHFDQAEGAVGGFLVDRHDSRDHVADIAHLVDRDDRLVADRDAVVRVRQPFCVGAGYNRGDASQRFGAPGVNRADAGMRVRAAQHLRVQHAGQADIEGVASRTGDLLGAVERNDRRAEPRGATVHQPALALAAARTASTII